MVSFFRIVLVNQLGCPRGRALVLAQSSVCVLHQTLTRPAVAEKLGNSALERVGIANLHCGVV